MVTCRFHRQLIVAILLLQFAEAARADTAYTAACCCCTIDDDWLLNFKLHFTSLLPSRCCFFCRYTAHWAINLFCCCRLLKPPEPTLPTLVIASAVPSTPIDCWILNYSWRRCFSRCYLTVVCRHGLMSFCRRLSVTIIQFLLLPVC